MQNHTDNTVFFFLNGKASGIQKKYDINTRNVIERFSKHVQQPISALLLAMKYFSLFRVAELCMALKECFVLISSTGLLA